MSVGTLRSGRNRYGVKVYMREFGRPSICFFFNLKMENGGQRSSRPSHFHHHSHILNKLQYPDPADSTWNTIHDDSSTQTMSQSKESPSPHEDAMPATSDFVKKLYKSVIPYLHFPPSSSFSVGCLKIPHFSLSCPGVHKAIVSSSRYVTSPPIFRRLLNLSSSRT